MKRIIIFSSLLVMMLTLSCVCVDKNIGRYWGQIQIIHIGDQDKPIREFLIYTEADSTLVSASTSNLLKYTVTDSLFQALEEYVINENTHRITPSNYNWGTFRIVMNSKSDSLTYIVDDTNNVSSFFIGFINLLEKNSYLRDKLESEIISRLD